MQLKTISIALCALLNFSPSQVFSQDSGLNMNNGNFKGTTIYLTAVEREAVLSEMRGFVKSTAGIVKGLSAEDMEMVTASARKSGRGAGAHMPHTLHKKLPVSFKKLGSDTHRRFDELALDAEQLGDAGHSLSQLGALLDNCVSCHSSFRIKVR
ncbi:MAG: hypothetical protein JAZ20_08600 [Candidatus Thiodiazotropha weberae]|nr:hypothetical protein [Candidatus Thiodiazotropha lotti]MCG7930150.1 hypothetical protein [Candidatus Thiodiazotropha lotti]MCG7989160.1 hypothetical protein [Candidatus Thiodiazotropha lotti]MCG8020462.1 hypothetical protein [Candidatus Thiodiazotropha lotti]MCW4207626.1 hypothetical protein [Candidatus Thiodiazotropha lotti]